MSCFFNCFIDCMIMIQNSAQMSTSFVCFITVSHLNMWVIWIQFSLSSLNFTKSHTILQWKINSPWNRYVLLYIYLFSYCFYHCAIYKFTNHFSCFQKLFIECDYLYNSFFKDIRCCSTKPITQVNNWGNILSF